MGRIIKKTKKGIHNSNFQVLAGIFICLCILFYFFPKFLSNGATYQKLAEVVGVTEKEIQKYPPLDKALYDAKIISIANNPPLKEPDPSKSQEVQLPELWPVSHPYPKDGAILPFKRIIAYYGNLYSTKMGVLGEYKEEEMFARLKVEVDKWNKADPATPVQPALHYIAVVAQGSPGKDGMYRFRMPDSEIEKVLKMADKINAIVFLDIQVGLSNLETEIPIFEKYLEMPNVHLAVDPEFSMKTGAKPGKVVGTLDAVDINFAVDYLTKIVKENNLPPKVLVVHRYTQKMLTNYQNIKTVPEVQIIVHMDGWGPAPKKISTYKQFVRKEPVQFTGFKLFYKNDLWEKGTVMMSPEDLLKLSPIPLYIQFQ